MSKPTTRGVPNHLFKIVISGFGRSRHRFGASGVPESHERDHVQRGNPHGFSTSEWMFTLG